MYAVHVNWSKSAAFYDIVYSLSVYVCRDVTKF